jgi:hypothetical protein
LFLKLLLTRAFTSLVQILGFFLLGGVEVTPLVVAGIAMNTFGGIWYAFAKYKQRQKRHNLLPRKSSDLESIQKGESMLLVSVSPGKL